MFPVKRGTLFLNELNFSEKRSSHLPRIACPEDGSEDGT